ncbi:hypothetical protein BC828DRAFT_408771 [Blastocladiella britannica]|nr:hypothetical protein BC828DRAFT_408771 [Blastocladiella britannica]
MSPPPPTAAYPRHRQSSSSGHPETSAVGQQEEEDVAHYPIVTFRSMPIYPNVREDVRSAIFRTATMASPCSRLAHHVAIRYSCISEEEELVLGDDEGRTAEVKASMLVVELRLPLTLATPGDLQAHTPSAPEHDDNNTEGASASPLQRRLSQPSLLLTPPPALSVSLRKFAQSLFGYPVGVFPFPGVIYPLRTLGLLPYSIRDLSRFPRLSIVRAPIGLLKKMYTALRRLPRHIPVGILAIVEGPEEAMDMVQWLDRSAKRGWPSDAADEDLMLSLHAGPGSGGSIASGSSTTHPSPSLDFLRSASSTLTPVPSSWAGSNLFMETSPSLALHLNPLPQSAVTLLEGLMGLNASIKMLESNMTLGSSNTNPSRGPLPMRLHAPGAAGPTSLAPWSRGSLPMSSPEITEWERVMEMGKQCESSPMPSTGSVPMSPGAQVAASAAAAKELAEKTSCDKRRSAPDRATSLPADPWSAPKDGWIPLHLVEIGMEPVVPALVVLGGNAGLEVPPTMGSILATSCTAGISSFDDLRQRDAVSAGAELWVGAIGGGRLRGGSGAGSGPRSRSLALRTLREDSIQALLRSVKVLVAEDDRVLSKILCKYLEQRGVRYRAAPNGPTALTEFVDQGPFQLMLLNLRLENTMSGFECAERVRAIERDARDRLLGTSPPVSPLMPPPPLPCTIIGITSETTATVHHAARLAGCNDVVIKPVNLQWIENKILECASLVALVTTPLSETEELRASPLPRRAETVTRMQPPPLPHHPHSSVLDL